MNNGPATGDATVARRLLCWMDRLERWACMTAFLLLVAVLAVDMLVRGIAGSGVPWAQQTGIFANLVIALLGMGLAAQGGEHLRPRFADRCLYVVMPPARVEAFMQRLQPAVTSLVLTLFAIIAIPLVLETAALGEQATVLHIPLWPLQALLPLAFLLAALRYVLYAAWPALAPTAQQEAA